MSTRHFFFVLLWLTVCLSACQDQPDYCTVKGTVKGIDDSFSQLTHFSEIKMAPSSSIPAYRHPPTFISTPATATN